MSVWIDGRPVTAEPIDLSDPAGWQMLVPLARGLPDGLHTVRLERAGPGPLAVDALQVDRSLLPGLVPWLGLLLALATGVILAAGIRLSLPPRTAGVTAAHSPPRRSGIDSQPACTGTKDGPCSAN